jgi:SAM-dependent methyltransferase
MDHQALYSFRFRNINQKSRENVWKEISAYISKKSNRPIRVLDPACGKGEFINSCPAREKWAVDIGTDGSELNHEIAFIHGSFFDADLPESYFDLVFLSNILEHMESQSMVNRFLEKAFTLLRPGGIIIVMGPNFKYCARNYFDCADHTVILTHVSVEEHLAATKFDLVQTSARFLPYSFRSKLPTTRCVIRFYLKFKLIWPFFGKQFLVVAKRPDAASI